MGTPQFTPGELGRLKTDNTSQTITSLAQQTSEYRRQHPNEKHGGIFNKDVILDILKPANCVAMRYYFGIDISLQPDDPTAEIRNPTLIICGVDANGDDILSASGTTRAAAEKSWACPPDCSAITTLSGVQ